ncbi:hypothetical protein N7454_005399 [Penicillium verhagenii]|nr:hypothetical protein N7454_005399 [Penicillium verhagenii]
MPFYIKNTSHTATLNTFERVQAEIIRLVDDGCTESVWLFGISAEIFDQIHDESSRTSRFKYIYNFDKQKLYVRMPHNAHELLDPALRELIDAQLKTAGVLWTKVSSMGSPTIKVGSIAAEPNGCYMHIGRTGKTVCIEIGNSQSERILTQLAHHWIEHSDSTILVCLLVKLSAGKNTITLSVWRRAERHVSRPGLRSQSAKAVMTESVKIIRADPDHLVRFTKSSNLHGDEIRIPVTIFTGEESFSVPVENVILDESALCELGARLWRFSDGFN